MADWIDAGNVKVDLSKLTYAFRSKDGGYSFYTDTGVSLNVADRKDQQALWDRIEAEKPAAPTRTEGPKAAASGTRPGSTR